MTDSSRLIVATALHVMSARFRERLPLRWLAAEVGVSPSHLCRIFRRATGVTVHQHLVRLRVKASLQPVLKGAALTDLAFDLGFASHSHFTAAFRRVYGRPPSALRLESATVPAPATDESITFLLAAPAHEHDRCSATDVPPDTFGSRESTSAPRGASLAPVRPEPCEH